MHHLHPRSRTTSTLFTTTLAISFLVVGLPHILPCPVDRRQFADSIDASPDGRPQRRRRKRRDDDAVDDSPAVGGVDAPESGLSEGKGRPARECPVPKPSGLVGQIMGFEKAERERDVPVVVRSLKGRNVRVSEERQEGKEDAAR